MLCLFLDAFRPEYLRYTDYIKSLTKENLYGKLEVPLGFTSIIASFLTGCYPDKHGLIDLYEKTNPHFQIKNTFLLNGLNLLKNERLFYKPLKIKEAKYFKTCITKAWPQKNSLKITTLFDILESNNVSFTSIDWPNLFVNGKGKLFLNKSAKNILKLTKKAKTDFVFSHFLDLEIAHKYGVNSSETKKALERIDNIVRELDQENLIIFSDHGMDDIEKKFDLKSELDNLGLVYGKDYIYFLGSTMARFWFNNKNAENKTKELLNNTKQGKIINPEKHHLPKTCDLIFLADFKTVFHPSFFNTNYKAMHGWKEQKAFYLIRGLKGYKDMKITNLLPYILKILNLPQVTCDGSL